MSNKIMLVAWRDFKSTVATKAFILAILGVPVLMVVGAVIAGVMIATHEPPALRGAVAIVDPTGEVISAAQIEFDPKTMQSEQDRQNEAIADAAKDMTNMEIDPAQMSQGPGAGMGVGQRGEVSITVEGITDPAQLDAIKERVRSGELLAVAQIPEHLLAANPGAAREEAAGENGAGEESTASAKRGFPFFVRENVSAEHTTIIERMMGQAIVRARVERHGMNLDDTRALLNRPRAATERFVEGGGTKEENAGLREVQRMLIPMAFMMLTWIAVFSVGQHLLSSTIEEKSNRVMEVLLSAVSPLQLLTGKIIGQGAVGLLILVVYSGLGIAGLISFSLMGLITITQLLLLTVFFFMAYGMIASLMAAVGSAVTDIREANSLLTPVMLVLIFPLMLWMPITQDPNGMIATVFSFIPPVIPFVMVLRIATDTPPPVWQILLSIVWGGACLVGMVWFASKVFRVGVLMTGKPPSPMELIKWVRYR